MHRVFYPGDHGWAVSDPAFGPLRAQLCALGLAESVQDGGWLYWLPSRAGRPRLFATLHGHRSSATIYLYPDALGRGLGAATDLYRTLEDAGLGMGSKAGPSIGIDLRDQDALGLLTAELRKLFAREKDAVPTG